MQIRNSLRQLTLLAAALCLLSPTARAASPGAEMAAAANNFLNALTPEQKAVAVIDLKSDERLNWHFIPKNDRKGLQVKDMTPSQRNLAHALLSAGMSQRGYSKAVTIMSLESILHEMEKGKGNVRDAERYFVSIFGTPGDKGAWGWRVEGHHFSQNFTIVNGKEVASTPSFMGTNPGLVLEGSRKGLRVLGVEEELARTLVKSLNDEQKKSAIYTNVAPKDIITMADKKVSALPAAGIATTKLTKEQNEQLMKVIKEYIYRVRPDVADTDMAKIQKAGVDKITFAWAGGTEQGQGHYYRIQGPTFLLEYDNTQNNANHVHAVWRDFNGDFGQDILAQHYKAAH
jgi:hypothetical protein